MAKKTLESGSQGSSIPSRNFKSIRSALFWYCFSILSFCLSFLLNYLHSNSYDFLKPEVLLLLSILVIGLFLVALSCHLLSLEWFFYSILILLLIDFTFGTGYLLLNKIEWNVNRRIVSLAICYGIQIVPLGFLACLVKNRIRMIGATIFGALFFATIAVVPFRTAAFYKIERSNQQKKFDNTKGNIIFLILDEHIGLDGIPQDIDGGTALRTNLLESYCQKGFKVYEKAYTNYSNTTDSIPSLLNLEIHYSPQTDPGDKPTDPADNYRLLENFANQGYQLYFYQNPFVDFCSLKQLSFAQCFTYPMNSARYAMDLNIPLKGKLWILLDGFTQAYKSQLLKNIEFKLSSQLYDVKLASLAIDAVLEQLKKDIKQNQNGTVFFVHLLMPHRSYVYDCDCKLNPWTSWENRLISLNDNARSQMDRQRKYKLYMGQVECLHKKLGALLEFLQKEGLYQSSTVVMTGDHGSRIVASAPQKLTQRDYLDLYSTFLAIKSPFVNETNTCQLSEDKMPVIRVLSDYFHIPLKQKKPDDFSFVYKHKASNYESIKMVDFPTFRR